MTITTQSDIFGGKYYIVHMDQPASQVEVPVESIPDLDRFICSFRDEPFFMRPMAGSSVDAIPQETQWLGVRHKDGSYSVYFSMAFEKFRSYFYGKDGQLCISARTGDDALAETEFCAYYRIDGTDFYAMVRHAAQSLAQRYGTCRLRWEKKKPEMMNLFGWCTWDSFYDFVKGEDIPVGLESFKKGGFVPKLLILDDGWQTTADQEKPRGQWKLSGLQANEKFAPNLKHTVDIAKDYGVEKFFVWHAIGGYWGGIDPNAEAMKKYEPVLSQAVHTDGIRALNPTRWEQERFDFGLAKPEKYAEFYDDYHGYLKSQGVAGVKVDVQSSMESHGQGRGGGIAVTRAVRQALESSVQKHFGGEIINCMSNGSDMVYHYKDSNLTRSSGDFYPERMESHSAHIFHNAVNSIWLSQFVWCDWDMFQTTHLYGPYHAAARAISGSPVYVSDRVDEHDFDLIRSLMDRDGKTLLAQDVAMPTLDCLFHDPCADRSLYKIFNRNAHNSVVGVFSYGGPLQTVTVSPRDVVGNTDGMYALYSHKTGKTMVLPYDGEMEVSLEGMQWDIITISKIERGFAIIGLTEKLNCGAAVQELQVEEDYLQLQMADRGHLLVYTQKNGFQVVDVLSSGHVRVEY